MGLGVQQPTLTVDGVSDCVIPASQGNRACRVGAHADPISPAKQAGFKSGDEILALNGQPVSSWDDFSARIRANAGGHVNVLVNRGGKQVTLSTNTTVSQRPDLNNPATYVKVGFLGVLPTEVRVRKSFGFVASTIGDYTQKTGLALVHLPQRMVGVAKAALGLEKRDPNSPMSVVGASRVAGEVASSSDISLTDRWATLLTLLGVVNLFVALFNFIPLLPLDGGHIAGALFEAVRRGLARVRGRPDPGYADVAQLLPIAYAAASILIVMGVLLVWADIVNPIRISG
jgi:membrane-associated protease RseP (regulator of RpoE activity)